MSRATGVSRQEAHRAIEQEWSSYSRPRAEHCFTSILCAGSYMSDHSLHNAIAKPDEYQRDHTAATFLLDAIIPEDHFATYALVGWSHLVTDFDVVGELLCFDYDDPISDSTLRREFDALVDRWTRETMLSSSITHICMHEAYQQIIGLGERVLPLVFEEMLAGQLHWSWALSAITRDNPAEGTESPRAATDAWIAWGRDRGLVD